jgi:hypothetical protein
MSGAHMTTTFYPLAEDAPRSNLYAVPDGSVRPVLRLAALGSFQQVDLTLMPDDPAAAVRYLRQLAAVATDLADEVQDATVKAVLSS